jgi:hypothetical protein
MPPESREFRQCNSLIDCEYGILVEVGGIPFCLNFIQTSLLDPFHLPFLESKWMVLFLKLRVKTLNEVL